MNKKTQIIKVNLLFYEQSYISFSLIDDCISKSKGKVLLTMYQIAVRWFNRGHLQVNLTVSDKTLEQHTV